MKRNTMKRKVAALLISGVMVFSMTACSGNGNGNTEPTSAQQTSSSSEGTSQPTAKPSDGAASTETTPASGGEDAQGFVKPEQTVVIRYGTHWVNGIDPNYTDPVTGDYVMGESARQAALAGLAAIKEELNVEFEFLQYTENTKTELLTSVLAGNPVCDIAVMWNGSESVVLAQNVLQKLDDYTYLFEDEDAAWLLDPPMFNHYYLLDNDMVYVPYFPLVVNLTMIEKVDALKDETGRTIYPMDLYKNGEWTWSNFEDYLSKINAYYSNVAAPDGTLYDTVQAYETDFRFAALAAMYANGGGIYKNGSIAADSDKTIDAVNFIQKLRDTKLMTDCGLYDDGYTPMWCQGGADFRLGGTVFSDVPVWQIGGYAAACSDRGESITIMPWPRADRLDIDSPEYKQVFDLGDSVGILKGIDEQKTELAIRAYILYWETYYKTLGGVDSVAEYKDAAAVNELAAFGVDLYNDVFGDDALMCFKALAGNLEGNPAGLLGLSDGFNTLLGKSLTGTEGVGSYDVAIKANLDTLAKAMSGIAANLATDEIYDNQPPVVEKVTAIIPKGTKYEDVDWTQYFTAEDSVDGVLDPKTATIEKLNENLDLNVVGIYKDNDSVRIHINDKSGNEGTNRLKIVVYNPENKEKPVATPKAELPVIKIDTDTSTINWLSYFDSALDADGLDILEAENIKADLSSLDTTTVGTYDVDITVTDYAGNTVIVTLEIKVVNP